MFMVLTMCQDCSKHPILPTQFFQQFCEVGIIINLILRIRKQDTEKLRNLPEITQLGRGGGRIRTQVVCLQICAPGTGVGREYSAHSRLSRKLIDVKEEVGREDSEERKKESLSGQVMRKGEGTGNPKDIQRPAR